MLSDAGVAQDDETGVMGMTTDSASSRDALDHRSWKADQKEIARQRLLLVEDTLTLVFKPAMVAVGTKEIGVEGVPVNVGTVATVDITGFIDRERYGTQPGYGSYDRHHASSGRAVAVAVSNNAQGWTTSGSSQTIPQGHSNGDNGTGKPRCRPSL
jgi:hypothetical protein